MKDFWPSVDRRMPKDEPDCGFRGEKCDYTLLILGGSLLVVFSLLALGAFGLHRFLEKRDFNRLSFSIDREGLQRIGEEQVRSMVRDVMASDNNWDSSLWGRLEPK